MYPPAKTPFIACIFPFLVSVLSKAPSYVQHFRVRENTPAGVVIGQLTVQHQISFSSLAIRPISDFIYLHPSNGSLVTLQNLDREAVCQGSDLTSQSDPSTPNEEASCEVTFLVHVITLEESLLETVTLTVVDENDNSPIFNPSSFVLSIPESSPIGGLFFLPSAKDADLGNNGVQNYHLSSVQSDTAPISCPPYATGEEEYFTLIVTNVTLPMMKQIGELDYEKCRNLYYCLHAYDGDGLTSALLVRVEIQDVNDNSPQWIGSPYNVHLSECTQQQYQSTWNINAELRSLLRISGFSYDAPIRFLTQLSTIDADSQENGMVKYRVVGKKTDALTGYKVLVHENKVYVIGNLDYETTPRFSVTVEAKDAGGLTNTTKIDVTLTDCNDNIPKIVVSSLHPNPRENLTDWSYYKHADIWIPEEDGEEMKLATVTVSDADTGDNAAVDCDLEWNNMLDVNPFSLTSLKSAASNVKVPTVFVLLKRNGVKVDREVTSRLQINIVCTDKGHPLANTVKQMVDIGILDINDNRPKFKNTKGIAVQENESRGAFVGYIHASDADFGRNAVLKYFIRNCQSNDTTSYFAIDELTGKITTLKSLDREVRSSYCVSVTAVDEGTQQLSSSVDLNVTVLDVNDSPPVFSGNRNESGRIVFEIPESFDQERMIEHLIGQVNATDDDTGVNGTLEFSLKQTPSLLWNNSSPVYFRISRSGQIFVDGVLDREKQSEHEFTVVVSDTGPFHRRLTSEIRVLVRLIDQNDNGPVFTEPEDLTRSPLSGAATLNITHRTPVNSSLLRICAKDIDLEENSILNFTLRCSKYLRTYFDIQVVEGDDASGKCASLIMILPLTKMIQENNLKYYKKTIEHQMYVTVVDLGSHQFSKSARIRLFIREDPVSDPYSHQDIPSRQPYKIKMKSDNDWINETPDQGGAYGVIGSASDLNATTRMLVTYESSSFLGRTKTKYLFIVAVAIFAMFIIVLGLLALIFIRDFPTKRQTQHQPAPQGEAGLNSPPYSACQAFPVIYTPGYNDETSSLQSHSLIHLRAGHTKKTSNGGQLNYQLQDHKSTEIGLEFGGSNDIKDTRSMPRHLARNPLFQAPIIEMSNTLVSKYATTAAYASLQPTKKPLLSDIQQSVAVSDARHHDQGYQSTSLVFSIINGSLTSINSPSTTLHKQTETSILEANAV